MVTELVDLPGEDAVIRETIGFLRTAGAGEARHSGGRSLLDHLVETYLVVRRWGQPAWLQHAALIHSIYGTDARPDQLVSPTRRADVAAVAGEGAERIAYLFCVIPTRPLFAGTHLWARNLPMRSISGSAHTEPQALPSRAELDAVLLLHMANGAEQIQAPDGRPGRWLVRVRDLGELLIADEGVKPPPFLDSLSAFTDADEAQVRRAYLEALQDQDHAGANALALAAAVCPVLPEPCVWQAYLARGRGDLASCRAWAAEAGKRLGQLGTPWDKRLTYDEWVHVIDALERSAGEPARDRRPGR